MAFVKKTVGKVGKMDPKFDAKLDKQAGIKPGSPKDNALDKKRGVPIGVGQGPKKGKKLY